MQGDWRRVGVRATDQDARLGNAKRFRNGPPNAPRNIAVEHQEVQRA